VSPRHEFFELTAHEARALFSLLAPPQAAQAEEAEQAEDAQAEAAALSEKAGHGAHGEPERRRRACTPETKLREWVEARYTHLPLREKDSGTKLEDLYAAYAASSPPVHIRMLGRNKFAKRCSAPSSPPIGPHRNKENTVTSMYLLR
jgi:hypothetical protein